MRDLPGCCGTIEKCQGLALSLDTTDGNGNTICIPLYPRFVHTFCKNQVQRASKCPISLPGTRKRIIYPLLTCSGSLSFFFLQLSLPPGLDQV